MTTIDNNQTIVDMYEFSPTYPDSFPYTTIEHSLHSCNMWMPIGISSTQSISTFKLSEPDINPYDCCRSSGVLSFWDDPQEDIYSFDDGQPV
jgi:hypothetical protein